MGRQCSICNHPERESINEALRQPNASRCRLMASQLPPNDSEMRFGVMIDDDVTRKRGIYQYVLTRDEKYLAIRAFTQAMRRAAYERQKGICPMCKKFYEYGEMEADHITPWSKGGKTDAANCQMLCLEDNRRKGAK